MNYVDINKYIQHSKEERQNHLRLNESCHLIGADSRQCRALLAYVLGTTIPSGMKILCCHGCNNSKCSNPFHLYWGSAKDNVRDTINVGRHVSTRVIKYTGKRKFDWCWITNQIENRFVKVNSSIPEGYRKGRADVAQLVES